MAGEALEDEPWNPWRALRERPHVQLVFAELEDCDGRVEDDDGQRRILLDYRLGRVDRSATLAHELIHEERDILYSPTTPDALVEKEEHTVRAICTDRLVPPTKLAAFLACWDSELIGVTARMVAEEFDVPLGIAAHALRRFRAGF